MARTKKVQETDSEITEAQKLEAATNDPALSKDEFELGGKTYKIVHLKYKSYVAFLHLLEPVLKGIVGVATARSGLSGIDLGSSSVDVFALLQQCTENLPSLVQIICAQTDPAITVQTVEDAAESPFQLAEIVIKQIVKINLGDKFSNFFAQSIPLLMTK